MCTLCNTPAPRIVNNVQDITRNCEKQPIYYYYIPTLDYKLL